MLIGIVLEFNNGLTIAWTSTGFSNDYTPITYPITFVNIPFCVQVTAGILGGNMYVANTYLNSGIIGVDYVFNNVLNVWYKNTNTTITTMCFILIIGY